MKQAKFLATICVMALIAVMVPLCLSVSAVQPTLKGDADGDGDVTMKDVLLMRKFIAGWDVTLDTEAADVDFDGDVTMKDVLLIRQYIAGLKPLPSRPSESSGTTTTLAPIISDEPVSDGASDDVSDVVSDDVSDEVSENSEPTTPSTTTTTWKRTEPSNPWTTPQTPI